MFDLSFILNYLSVFIGFVTVLYIWPRIAFLRFLNGKSVYYKIFFCCSSMVLLCSLVIVVMALCNLVSIESVKIVFYGSLLIIVGIKIFRYLFSHEINDVADFLKPVTAWVANIKAKSAKINARCFSFWFNGLLNVIIILCVIVLCANFISYAYQNYEYGFSDMIRHEMICGQLFSNQAFSEGYYPIGMHSIMGIVIYLFQLNAHMTIQITGNIFTIVFFIALYFWLKNIFHSKTAISIVFLAFVLLTTTILLPENSQRVIYDGLHRLNWTLPQEACLWAVFVAPVCITGILKSDESIMAKTNIANLALLALTVGQTLCVHYYTTIFQFVVCLATFLVYVTYLNKQKFISFVVSVGSGIIFGFLNMFIGLLVSGQFAWALIWAGGVSTEASRVFEDIASVNSSDENFNLLYESSNPFTDFIYHIKTFYDDCLMPLFPGEWFVLFFVLMLISLAVFVLLFIYKKKNFQNYLPIALSVFVFLILYAAPVIGLPRLLESYRIVICIYATLLPFCCVSFDVGLNLLKEKFQIKKASC